MGQACSQSPEDSHRTAAEEPKSLLHSPVGKAEPRWRESGGASDPQALNPDLQPTSYLNCVPDKTPAILKRLGPFLRDPKLDALVQTFPPSRGPLISKTSGHTYQGGILHGVPHGLGTFIASDGTFVEGYFLHGFPDLKYVHVLPDGTGYNGEFKEGKKHGRGVCVLPDGDKVTADWAEDKMHGWTVIEDLHGKKVFEGKMIKNRKEGQCFHFDRKTNAVFNGDFRDGLYYGYGILESDEGVFEGLFNLGMKEGPGVLRKPNGELLEGLWKQNHLIAPQQQAAPSQS